MNAFFSKKSKKITSQNIKNTKNISQKSPPELSESEKKDLERLIESIEYAGLDEFMEYIRSPWRMLWPNFVAGVARGIGTLVGAAVVITLIGWFLARLIDLPLIGKQLEPYINKAQAEIVRYTESTNYSTSFKNLEKLLEEIRDELHSKHTTR